MEEIKRKIGRVQTLLKLEDQAAQALKHDILAVENRLNPLLDRQNDLMGKMEFIHRQVKREVVEGESINLTNHMTHQKILYALERESGPVSTQIRTIQQEKSQLEVQLDELGVKMKGYERMLSRYLDSLSGLMGTRAEASQDALILNTFTRKA